MMTLIIFPVNLPIFMGNVPVNLKFNWKVSKNLTKNCFS